MRREKKKALIAFIACGDPNLSTTEKLALGFADLGVDILELGVPFSDPLADGPTIQAASQRALKHNVNLSTVLALVKRLRKKTELPIVLLSYANVVYRFGLLRFIQQASVCGVDGVVIPDLPVEEAQDLIKVAKKRKFAAIFLLAPTSDLRRIREIAKKSSGFIYYVSLTGTTGARAALPKELTAQLKRIKRITTKPLCVGFGVSTPGQARKISQVADGVIVGSAIIKIIEKNLGRKDLTAKVTNFVRRLKQAI